ncbi:hypothetical protein MNV49_000096 [Pseudohyphozyma bogoriensis]|nr:hypothetical protein MNV49_000096 [Pseudohyphozyma bogoriensis]
MNFFSQAASSIRIPSFASPPKKAAPAPVNQTRDEARLGRLKGDAQQWANFGQLLAPTPSLSDALLASTSTSTSAPAPPKKAPSKGTRKVTRPQKASVAPSKRSKDLLSAPAENVVEAGIKLDEQSRVAAASPGKGKGKEKATGKTKAAAAQVKVKKTEAARKASIDGAAAPAPKTKGRAPTSTTVEKVPPKSKPAPNPRPSAPPKKKPALPPPAPHDDVEMGDVADLAQHAFGNGEDSEDELALKPVISASGSRGRGRPSDPEREVVKSAAGGQGTQAKAQAQAVVKQTKEKSVNAAPVPPPRVKKVPPKPKSVPQPREKSKPAVKKDPSQGGVDAGPSRVSNKRPRSGSPSASAAPAPSAADSDTFTDSESEESASEYEEDAGSNKRQKKGRKVVTERSKGHKRKLSVVDVMYGKMSGLLRGSAKKKGRTNNAYSTEKS